MVNDRDCLHGKLASFRWAAEIISRRCERSEAIQSHWHDFWIASSLRFSP
jgi:hypothetical protein